MSYSKSNTHTKSLMELMASKRSEVPKVVTPVAPPKLFYPLFNLAPFGKDITDKQLAERLAAVKKPDRSGTQVAVLSGVKSLQLSDSKATWSYTAPSMRSSPDESMYKRLMIAGLDRYAKPTEYMYRSNNTRLALFKRLSEQLVVQTNEKRYAHNVIDAAAKLPFKGGRIFNGVMSASDSCFEKMNMKASAGLPYAFHRDEQNNVPKVSDYTSLALEYRASKDGVVPLSSELIPITTHAFHWARKLWKIVDDAGDLVSAINGVGSFLEQYPELRTFMLKRKDEKHSRSDYNTKVRPYGCQPLATRIFCMWAVSPIETYIQNFVDNPKSISAYHFSPFYGGAGRILNYFKYHYVLNERKFFGISYGDDQLWAIRLSDGKLFILNPDVKAMDMNTQSDTVNAFGKWVKHNMPDIPDMNFNCLIVALSMAFRHAIHVGGPYILNKTQSLMSGIPGTTVINIYNSSNIQQAMEDTINNEKEPITAQNVFKVLSRCFDEVKKRLGYTFKGYEGLSVLAANTKSEDLMVQFKEQVYLSSLENLFVTGIPLTFLSMKIDVVKGYPVCVPADIYKLGSSLVLPGNTNSKKSVSFQKERLLGVAFSGGWYDEKFYEFLRNTFMDLNKIETSSVLEVSELNSNLEQDVFEILETKLLSTFPSREFLFDMNALEKEEFVEKYLVSSSKQIIEEPKSVSSKNEVVERVTSSFGDIVGELDDFNSDVLDPDPIKISKMGHANANTIPQEVVKKTKLRLRQDKKALRDFISDNFSGKTKRGRINVFLEESEYLDELVEKFEEEMDEHGDDYDDDEVEAYWKWKDEVSNYSDKWEAYFDNEAYSDVGVMALGDAMSALELDKFGPDDIAINERG